MAGRGVRWLAGSVVCVIALAVAAPAHAARAAHSLFIRVVVTPACDDTTGHVTINWSISDFNGDQVPIQVTVAPSGSTLDLTGTVIPYGRIPVGATQVAPVGAASATITVTGTWPDGPATTTSSVSFSKRCGPARPWATFVGTCDNTVVVTAGNGADAIGAAELTVASGRTNLATFVIPPGQQRSLTVPFTFGLAVFQYDEGMIGIWEWHAFMDDNYTPAQGCAAPVVNPPAPAGPPGGGSSGQTGGGPAASEPSATPDVTTPTPASSTSVTSAAVAPSSDPVTSPALTQADASRVGGLLAIWTAVLAAIVVAVAAAAYLLYRRRSRAAGPDAPL
jgi:hypothetical protein